MGGGEGNKKDFCHAPLWGGWQKSCCFMQLRMPGGIVLTQTAAGVVPCQLLPFVLVTVASIARGMGVVNGVLAGGRGFCEGFLWLGMGRACPKQCPKGAKSFGQAFSKACGIQGQSPWALPAGSERPRGAIPQIGREPRSTRSAVLSYRPLGRGF